MAASSGLAAQTSLYSWALDDFHSDPPANESNYCKNNNNKKDAMGSMNMEELLRNIYATEDSEKANGGGGSPSLAAAPASSLLVPRMNKTVDEIWKEITTTTAATVTAANCSNAQASSAALVAVPPQRELTLGELTLEDFLAKAGVVREENQNPNPNHSPGRVGNLAAAAAAENWQRFQFNAQPVGVPKQQQIMQRAAVGFRKASPVAARVPALKSISTGGSVLEASSVVEASMESGATSSFSPFSNGLSLARGKKRCAEAFEEKAVDQRQRRMIKNRESAARSRERKQAYTVELETQLSQLKEENVQLTKQQEEGKRRRFKQLMETLIPVEQMCKPPRVLRRTRTTLW